MDLKYYFNFFVEPAVWLLELVKVEGEMRNPECVGLIYYLLIAYYLLHTHAPMSLTDRHIFS